MEFNKNTKVLIVGLGLMGGTYAQALAVEGTDVSFPNIVAIREGDDREELKTLVEVLQSDAIVTFIKDTYGTAVVPTK